MMLRLEPAVIGAAQFREFPAFNHRRCSFTECEALASVMRARW
jgi:hypothetical protein